VHQEEIRVVASLVYGCNDDVILCMRLSTEIVGYNIVRIFFKAKNSFDKCHARNVYGEYGFRTIFVIDLTSVLIAALRVFIVDKIQICLLSFDS
jgi:hypothetical protein